MTAELRIPQFQIGPTTEVDIAAEALTLKNSGPIVARFANSIITVENAHLVGRDTDLKITGRVLPEQKNPLDLRVDGRVDLGFLHDFNKDFVSSGNVVTEATVRGSLSDPQIAGRVKFEKAAFNIVDVPNGISNATGTVHVYQGARHHPGFHRRDRRRQDRSLRLRQLRRRPAGFPPARPCPPGARALSRGRQHRGRRQSEPDRHHRQQHALRHGHRASHRRQPAIRLQLDSGRDLPSRCRRLPRAPACWAVCASTCRSKPRPTSNWKAR